MQAGYWCPLCCRTPKAAPKRIYWPPSGARLEGKGEIGNLCAGRWSRQSSQRKPCPPWSPQEGVHSVAPAPLHDLSGIWWDGLFFTHRKLRYTCRLVTPNKQGCCHLTFLYPSPNNIALFHSPQKAVTVGSGVANFRRKPNCKLEKGCRLSKQKFRDGGIKGHSL